MKSVLALLLILSLAALPAAAAQRIQLGAGGAGEPYSLRLLAAEPDRTVIQLELHVFDLETISIDGAPYSAVTLPGRALLEERGLPALPTLRESILIPDDAEMAVRVLASEYTDYAGLDIVPSKGSILRNVDPAMVRHVFADFYGRDAWYPRDLAALGEPYIMRDTRGAVLAINPFRYNPATHTLRVFHSLTVEVAVAGPGGQNVLTERLARRVAEFEQIYRRHYLNYPSGSDRYADVPEVGSMLVISYDAFSAAMQPFVDWKNQMGIPATLVDVSEVGSTGAQIKSYIQNAYDSEGVCFILLVGDAAQLPAIEVDSASSDPSYSLLAGADNYPDAFVGRFSAENISQVQTQVERAIEYERDPQAGAEWYHKGTGIASNQGPGDDGEYDNAHMDVIRQKLLGFTYTLVDQIYDPTGSAAMVSAALNEGRSIVNYCGHGWIQGWGSTGFDNNAVFALANGNKLPFITSVACNNGEYESGTCFGEAWLRAESGGEPSGAVGFYGSSISQSWNPPMCAQDEIIDLMVAEEKRCYGALCLLGSCQMMDEYGAGGQTEFLHWTVFGDPSLRVRTDTPGDISAAHLPTVDPLLDFFIVETEPGNLAALSDEGDYIGSAFADASGQAHIQFANPLPLPGSHVTLTVTGFNRETLVESVLVGDGLMPTCEVDPSFFNVVLSRDQTLVDWLHISNHGEEGSTLYYFIDVSDPNYPRAGGPGERNMSGSAAWCDLAQYYPGSTVAVAFHATNNSNDDEWIARLTLDLPAGVVLEGSPGSLTGGSGGDIAYVGGSGDGALCDWSVPAGEWGRIYPGETGDATLNLSFTGVSGDVVIPYVIYGDVWGSEPHQVAGQIVITQAGPNVSVVSPNGGEVWAVGEQQRIEFWGGGGPEFVKIELNRDGGFGHGEWELLEESCPLAGGGYDWTVTGPVSAHCVMKVTDVDDASVTDFSDGHFTIYRPLTWVATEVEQGSVPEGDSDAVRLTFDSHGLPEDIYEADITLVSNAGAPIVVPVSITVLFDATDAPAAPAVLTLAQNHPNPFNPKTSISFTLPAAGEVKLAVYDVAGQRVITLINGKLPAGNHHVIWDGKDQAGKTIASGVYCYRLEAPNQVLNRKMLMLK